MKNIEKKNIHFCLGCTKIDCGSHKNNVNKFFNKDEHKLLHIHSKSCIRSDYQYYMVQK